VLDCYYSGNFRHKGDPAALPFTAGRGQAVLTSSQLGVTSLDAQTAGEPSPFTGHFAAALRGAARDHTGKGFLTSEDIYQYVHTQMAAEGPHRPARSQELVGDVALARARSGAVTADELDPDASATRTGAALELLDRNRAAAVQELRLLSESAHGDWRLFAALRLADLAASDGDTTTAIEAYGRVASAGHRHWSPEADHQLGVQLSATGDAERAVIAWRRAADSGRDPWAARAAHRLGELLVGRSETTEVGLRYLRQAAAAEPAAAVDLGDTLRRCGEIDEARSVYRRVVAAGDPRWSATAGARLAGSAPP